MYYLKTSYRKNYLGILFYNSPLGWQPQSVACMFPTAAYNEAHPPNMSAAQTTRGDGIGDADEGGHSQSKFVGCSIVGDLCPAVGRRGGCINNLMGLSCWTMCYIASPPLRDTKRLSATATPALMLCSSCHLHRTAGWCLAIHV